MKPIQHCLGLALLSLPGLASAAATTVIEEATRITVAPVQYGRVDFVIMLTAKWEDPFRARQVRLDLEVTAPSGQHVIAPAYFERGASGATSVWRARFAPREAGRYEGRFALTTPDAPAAYAAVAFQVAASSAPGFLHLHDAWTFRFDNGAAFRGIGQNLCWEARSFDDSRHFKALHENQRYNYEYLLGTLAANGGTFFRTWMCAWNLPLEWKRVNDTTRYADDPGHFNASAIQRMDQLVELATATQTYFMLTLDAHGAFLGRGWKDNNYNRANGGPVSTPLEFFTSPAAKEQYQDRLRYLVARWGYSPHLAVWEFFNEIDNAMYGQKPQRLPDEVIAAWHAEMSAYLRALDPYGRAVTTSVSHRAVAGMDDLATMDFNQRHIYKNTDAIPDALRGGLTANRKPWVIGEFGYEWDWNKDFNTFADRMDHDFKHGLWLGLFSPTPILPMSWWWEFFDQRKLPGYFARVRALHEEMVAAGGGRYQELLPHWSGAPLRHVLGVQCGARVFVLLSNTAKAAATGQLSVGETLPDAWTVQIYDPETDRSTAQVSLATPITVSADADLILILAPRR